MAISAIYTQAVLARTDDVAKLEQSKDAIKARQVERNKQRSQELAEERIYTIDEALEENVVEKIGDDDHQKRRRQSHLKTLKPKKDDDNQQYRDLDLGGHIDLSI